MFLVVVLAEFRRCAPSSLLEYPVEIGYIIKSALITNLHDGHGAVGIVFIRREGKHVALGAVYDHIFLAGNGPRCLIIIVVLRILLG